MLPSNPERDQRLAHSTRYGPRTATALADLIQERLEDPIFRKGRQYAKIRSLIETVCGPQASYVRILALRGKTLLLSVEGGVRLSELRTFKERQLVCALVESGTGLDRVTWRLASAKGQK
jgi:hypothetical protein